MSTKVRNIPSPIRTSPQKRDLSIGSSPVSAHEEERMKQILAVFESIDSNTNKQLTFDEFHSFLSNKQGEEFDFILCQELFARLDKDNDAVVTIEEFVSNYVEVENLILKQIRTVNKEIQKLEASLKDNKEKLSREKTTEVLNSNGIMKGSVFTITVKSAVGLFPTTADGLCNAYAVVECDGTNFTTKIIPSSLNPMWDEKFEIPINSKSPEMYLTVYSKSALGTKFVGKVSVALRTLSDQVQKEQYYNLLSETGEPWQGKVLLEHQWMWSKVKYYSDIISQQEKFVQEDKNKVENLKAQREKLMKPFGPLNDGNDFIFDKSISNLAESQIIYPPKERDTLDQWSDSAQVVVGLIYVYIVLAVFNSFKRPDFVNVIFIQTIASVTGFYHWRYQDSNGMRQFLILLMISEGYDLVWVLIFGKAWLAVETLAVFLCLFLIGFKAILGLVVAKRYGLLGIS